MEEPSTTVFIWWGGMSFIAFLNVCLLVVTYRILKKKMSDLTATILYIHKCQFALASIYVVGCGFRSILPRGDIRRIVLVDSWISSVMIGRTVATIAELTFVAQWALILYEISIYIAKIFGPKPST